MFSEVQNGFEFIHLVNQQFVMEMSNNVLIVKTALLPKENEG